MNTFSDIAIIYNPKSSGDSKKNAHELFSYLTKNKYRVVEIATKYANHAEQLAKEFADSHKKPLIISASGDGGYHEVINGVIASDNKDAVCAVLPSGNANDHARTVQKAELAQLITTKRPKQIDLLKLTVKHGAHEEVRYAHSYIGLGITPQVAKELNKTELNPINEKMIVGKTIANAEPFTIKRRNRSKSYDSLLFANINEIAKTFKIQDKLTIDDGQFEVVAFRHKSKWQLVKKLARSATLGAKKPKSYEKYKFKLTSNTPIQLDGEVMKVKADSLIVIESAHLALRTII